MKIAIFTYEKHKDITLKAIEYYKSFTNLPIVVVCPRSSAALFSKPDIEVLCDEEIFGFSSIQKICSIFKYKSGWYLQQFLKLSYYYHSDDDVLIIDGDTVLSEYLISNIVEGSLFFTMENFSGDTKAFEGYNNFIVHKNLLSTISQKCYICNFGLFRKDLKHFYPENILDFFESSAELIHKNKLAEKTWWSSLNFSEYQINGQLSERNAAKSEKLNIFRRGDLLIRKKFQIKNINTKTLESIFKKYHCISYETEHKKTYVKKIISEILFIFSRSW